MTRRFEISVLRSAQEHQLRGSIPLRSFQRVRLAAPVGLISKVFRDLHSVIQNLKGPRPKPDDHSPRHQTSDTGEISYRFQLQTNSSS